MKLKTIPEGQEIRPVAASDIYQAAFLPAPGQLLQFPLKNGIVSKIIPARGYLIENFFHLHSVIVGVKTKWYIVPIFSILLH